MRPVRRTFHSRIPGPGVLSPSTSRNVISSAKVVIRKKTPTLFDRNSARTQKNTRLVSEADMRDGRGHSNSTPASKTADRTG
jgi:hypothetical protein